MRVLAIGAHPDDCEFQAGGTLAKYAKAGHDIFMCSATNGEIGSNFHEPEELAKIRFLEATKAASLIGAKFICLGFRDQRFVIDESAREVFVDLFREVNPDVVITHPWDDFSGDHRLVGQMVNDICMLPMVPNIKTRLPHTDKAPVLYYWMAPGNISITPEQFVDITEEMETKKAMIGCHETQLVWSKYHTGADLVDDAAIDSRFRGLQSGVRYAEAFTMVKAAPRTCCGTLLP